MLKMIFFLLVWSVVPLLAGMMCNEAKPKKGIILGATLPYSARSDARVLDITRRFRRAQWLWVLIETAAWVPLHFLTGEGVAIGVMCVMFIPMIIVPYAIYIRANKKLRELKRVRGLVDAVHGRGRHRPQGRRGAAQAGQARGCSCRRS